MENKIEVPKHLVEKFIKAKTKTLLGGLFLFPFMLISYLFFIAWNTYLGIYWPSVLLLVFGILPLKSFLSTIRELKLCIRASCYLAVSNNGEKQNENNNN